MFDSNEKILGYCTNVHAGNDYATTLENLDRYAVEVKKRVSPDEPMGVGLWLPNSAALEIVQSNRIAEFRDWLEGRGLRAFTMNGFPYGDFHEAVVKHAVYRPTWAEPARLDYTKHLVRILGGLLPKGAEGSISTVPIAWPDPDEDVNDEVCRVAARNLLELVDHLAREEAATGHCIHVDIEPEPGCLLDTSAGVVEFLEEYVFSEVDKRHVSRYLRVCHDVCHAAVMGESQTEVFKAYRNAGVRVGKIQISSAVVADFAEIPPDQTSEALGQLAMFQEPRYLHQTAVASPGDNGGTLYTDLPAALAAIESGNTSGLTLRTHFHVPVYLEQFGHLQATRAAVAECLASAAALTDCRHFEVETYAWNVLPEELQVPDLAEGIAREMQWVLDATRETTGTAGA